MTQAKAQACASAIIGAGYNASATQLPDGTWKVRAVSGDFSIPNTQIDSLVTAQTVTALVQQVEFS